MVTKTTTPARPVPHKATAVDPDPDERTARLMAPVERVEDGDLSLMPALRKGLDENPALWQGNGDLANTVVRTWVDAIGGTNEVLKECVRRQLRKIFRDLAGDQAPPSSAS